MVFPKDMDGIDQPPTPTLAFLSGWRSTSFQASLMICLHMKSHVHHPQCIATTPHPDHPQLASQSTVNSILKSGYARIGEVVSIFIRELNACSHSFVHTHGFQQVIEGGGGGGGVGSDAGEAFHKSPII